VEGGWREGKGREGMGWDKWRSKRRGSEARMGEERRKSERGVKRGTREEEEGGVEEADTKFFTRTELSYLKSVVPEQLTINKNHHVILQWVSTKGTRTNGNERVC
jgi:hypothetical protein